MEALPVLRAQHLSKTIGRRLIVDDVSIEVRRGEILGFLGPNGAGKTTTIRMLVGLIRPSGGTVEIAGHDLRSDFEAAMRKVGCIVEGPDLYRFMTGRENLEHFARMIGEVRPEEIEAVAATVDMAHRLDEKVRTYSLGMRQRLGIAQALLGGPDLLILDEPANGLDPAGIREMRELLRGLARERDLGILISSHLLGEVEQMCDRVAIIHRGRLLTSGPVSELLTRTDGWLMQVDRADAAASIMRDRGLEVARNDGWLEFQAGRELIPNLIEALVREGIAITSVQPRKRTLEERFLDETHGETV
ncbi:MAG TPA: ABC transporter ATP-binding protein [Thermoanaerobaculia bacterium]|nr:ABC transporter ATP-binding protein [Thermoanaerobaculia bacterium]